MDLLAFERKLDSTIMRKRLDIQEALKRPMKQKRKLRIFISNTSFPAKEGAEGGAADDNTAGGATTAWELRVEGRLIDEIENPAAATSAAAAASTPKTSSKVDPAKSKRKFSSFFKVRSQLWQCFCVCTLF